MGDPVGAARHVRAGDRARRHLDGRRADGRRPRRGQPQPGRAAPTTASPRCCARPSSLSQEVGLALGTQAGPARIRDVVTTGGFSRFATVAADARSTRSSRSGPDPVTAEQTEPMGPQPQAPATEPDRHRHRRARRRHARLRGLRRREHHGAADADLDDRALPVLEGPGRLPGPALPRGHLRRAGQRPVRPAGGRGGVHRRGVRRRRPRRAGRHRHRARGRWSRCPAGPPGRCTLAAEHPDRVLGIFALGAGRATSRVPRTGRDVIDWDGPSTSTEGWAKYNRHYWLEGGYDDFLEFFFGQMFSEPHSTKQIEDCVGWARETTPQTLVDTTAGMHGCDGVACTPLEDVCARVSCPVLVVHGTEDAIRPPRVSERLAELTGGSLVLLEGCGHGPMARAPGRVNLLIREFVERCAARRRPSQRRRPGRGPATPTAGALPVLADRAGPRPARPRDRRGAAQAAPRPRDRLARPAPGHRGARGGGRAGPPGVGVAGQRVGAHRARGGRARPARLPGDPADGRDPGQQLHGLRGGRRATSTTTSSSATRPGTSTTSCTRTPS